MSEQESKIKNLKSRERELCVEEKTMRRRKIITTNLGDLIVALIDEVTPIIRDPSVMYIVYIVVSSLSSPSGERSSAVITKIPTYLAEEVAEETEMEIFPA
jgi:hypothetical protein